MGWAFGMLLFDTVLYIALILYYDYSEEAKSKKSSGSDASGAQADDGDYHVSHGQITGLKTDSAESAAVGIRVRKLSKLYGEPAACGKESTLVHAVKGIDFDVPEKHIFALLGHNGVRPPRSWSLSQCCKKFIVAHRRARPLRSTCSSALWSPPRGTPGLADSTSSRTARSYAARSASARNSTCCMMR